MKIREKMPPKAQPCPANRGKSNRMRDLVGRDGFVALVPLVSQILGFRVRGTVNRGYPMQVRVLSSRRGGAGALIAIAASAVVVLLAAPMGASATLPGSNGLVWGFNAVFPQQYSTYDLATGAARPTGIKQGPERGGVSFSGDASLVAFESGASPAPHISVLRMTGGVPVDLTPGPDGAHSPSFCGDGTIVFVKGKTDGMSKQELWVVSSAGGPARQLTSGSQDAFPSCSQDGTVVFVRDNQIWKTNVGGGTPSKLANGGQPDISPDGTSVVFLKSEESPYALPGAPPSGQSVLATMPIGGGTPQTVSGVGSATPGARVNVNAPSWSPDGSS